MQVQDTLEESIGKQDHSEDKIEDVCNRNPTFPTVFRHSVTWIKATKSKKPPTARATGHSGFMGDAMPIVLVK